MTVNFNYLYFFFFSQAHTFHFIPLEEDKYVIKTKLTVKGLQTDAHRQYVSIAPDARIQIVPVNQI